MNISRVLSTCVPYVRPALYEKKKSTFEVRLLQKKSLKYFNVSINYAKLFNFPYGTGKKKVRDLFLSLALSLSRSLALFLYIPWPLFTFSSLLLLFFMVLDSRAAGLGSSGWKAKNPASVRRKHAGFVHEMINE